MASRCSTCRGGRVPPGGRPRSCRTPTVCPTPWRRRSTCWCSGRRSERASRTPRCSGGPRRCWGCGRRTAGWSTTCLATYGVRGRLGPWPCCTTIPTRPSPRSRSCWRCPDPLRAGRSVDAVRVVTDPRLATDGLVALLLRLRGVRLCGWLPGLSRQAGDRRVAEHAGHEALFAAVRTAPTLAVRSIDIVGAGRAGRGRVVGRVRRVGVGAVGPSCGRRQALDTAVRRLGGRRRRVRRLRVGRLEARTFRRLLAGRGVLGGGGAAGVGAHVAEFTARA